MTGRHSFRLYMRNLYMTNATTASKTTKSGTITPIRTLSPWDNPTKLVGVDSEDEVGVRLARTEAEEISLAVRKG